MPRELRVLPRSVPVELAPAEDGLSGSVPVEIADVPDGQSVAAPTTILLIGHGSRDPEGADQHRRVAALLDARFGPARPVVPCFLELADPSILDAIDGCARAGVREIVALPFMLFGANHVKSDVPAAIIAARARHPDVAIRYGAPLDVQPEMLAALDDRIAAVERLDPSFGCAEAAVGRRDPSAGCAEAAVGRAETAILLVERGSSDPDANARVYQLARLLWEGRGFGWVEPCFIGITPPTLDEGMARSVALGARRVIVAPYFLFTGVLVRRIARMVGDLRAVYPRVRIEVAEHLGAHPSILDLAARRIEEASAGEVRMSCDRCKWRVPLVGFEQRVGQPQTSDRAHGLREGGSMGHHHGTTISTRTVIPTCTTIARRPRAATRERDRMPTYDFRCSRCEAVFEVRRRFGEDIDSAACPDDGAAATRLFSPPLDMLVYGKEPSGSTSSIRPPSAPASGPPHSHGHGHSHGPGTASHSH